VQTLFSTNDVHPRDRFDFWHSIACKMIVDHDSRPERRATFEAELQWGSLGDLELVLFKNSPMEVSNPRATADQLVVCRQMAGELAIEQNGREVLLQSGDITLLDPLLPYAGRFFSGSKLLVLKLPRRLLEARTGKTRQMIARRVRPMAAENSLASSFLAMLPAHAGRLGGAAGEIIADQVLDLVAVSFAKTMEYERPRVSSARSVVLLNLRGAVEAGLADPALDAETVAGAAGVSLRYANAVLAQEGTSVARLIQERRLARCRRALDDASQRHRTISEIAYGWGFSDMTHFGRRFKAAFGLSPRDYRSQSRDAVERSSVGQVLSSGSDHGRR
jgi:AraC family transcriptional regulator, positive regulator of tynA and feaB